MFKSPLGVLHVPHINGTDGFIITVAVYTFWYSENVNLLLLYWLTYLIVKGENASGFLKYSNNNSWIH